MDAKTEAPKPDLRRSIYVGTFVTAVVALLPCVSDMFITAYLTGAFAAVWFAIRRKRQLLTFKDGADLGFRSGFYGLLAASTIYDVIWQFCRYPLWQIQNADRMLAMLGGMVRDAFSPAAWIVITFQIIAVAIFAGAFGAPAGILAVKILRRREPLQG
jgi:hypothetical protein